MTNPIYSSDTVHSRPIVNNEIPFRLNEKNEIKEKRRQAVNKFQDTFNQICANDSGISITNAVKEFADSFLRLSLWEKFMDFFGFSKSADTQKGLAALYVIHTAFNLEGEHKLPHYLIKDALFQADLTKVDRIYGLEVMYADAIKNVKQEKNAFSDMIKLEVDNTKKDLYYRVSFDEVNSLGLKEYLPFFKRVGFSVSKVSPQDDSFPESNTTPKSIIKYLTTEGQYYTAEYFERELCD